ERDKAAYRLYLAHIHLAHQAWRAGNIPRLQELLDTHRPRGQRRDLRGWEWYYLRGLCHQDLFTLKEDPPESLEGASTTAPWVYWSPDGRRLAWVGYSANTAHVWDVKTRKRTAVLAGHTSQVYSVAWSPDGRRLATAGYSTIKVWKAATGKVLLTLRAPASNSLAWSPDGK